jgi:hypothetical protein
MALATAEAVARGEGRRSVSCCDIVGGIAALSGGVADNLLKARGFSAPITADTALDHDPWPYTVESLRAVSAAMLEAVSRSHELVGVEDMLVGLLSSPCAEISALFAQKSVNLEELLSEVRKEM